MVNKLRTFFIKNPDKKRLFFSAAIYFLTPFAIFYLFILPVSVASKPNEYGKLGIAFGSFLYLQLWMLVLFYIYEAAIPLYGFKRPELLESVINFQGKIAVSIAENDEVRRKLRTVITSDIRQGSVLIVTIFLSYFLTIYGFAIGYLFISSTNIQAFNTRLDFFNSFYFSFGTATLAAYGDIFPTMVISKILSMVEVFIGLLYTLFLFSVLSSFLLKKETSKELKDA